MRKKVHYLLKISLVGLFLTFTTALFGQGGPAAIPSVTPPVNGFSSLHVGTYNDGAGTIVNSMADGVLFYQVSGGSSATSITLQASTDDANGLNFDLYAWYKITDASGALPTAALGETTRNLTVNGLQPGFHRFRVYGIVESSTGTNCNSEEFQDIVIFVLNSLDPTVIAATTAITEFCISDNPTATNTLSTTINFASTYNSDLPGPAVSAFDYTYHYYAIKDGDTSNKISLGTATTQNGNTNTLDIDYSILQTAGVGTYTFFVEVSYSDAIKDNTGKAYAIWESQVTKDGSNYTIEVIPQPGRPTITIIGSSDN